MLLPDWLLWLLPVPLATCAAIGWASWNSRTRGPQRPAESVRAYEQFRAALAASVRSSRPPAGGAAPGGAAQDERG